MAKKYNSKDTSTQSTLLVGNWQIDDNSTTVMSDSSGNGYDLTNEATTPTVTAAPTYVAWPATANDDCFTNTASSALVTLNAVDSYLAMGRFYVDTTLAAAVQALFATRFTGSGIELAINASGGLTLTHNAGTSITSGTANSIISVNTEYFWAAGYDATTDNLFLYTSANGIFYTKTNTVDTNMTTAHGLMIGGRSNVDNPTDVRIIETQYYQKSAGGFPSNFPSLIKWAELHPGYVFPDAWLK